jgi:hypothetical protein
LRISLYYFVGAQGRCRITEGDSLQDRPRFSVISLSRFFLLLSPFISNIYSIFYVCV